MPKDKFLFFIGIWLIFFSYFVGLPTEIKNYVFVFTGIIIVIVSYGSYFSKEKTEESEPEEVKEVKEVKFRDPILEFKKEKEPKEFKKIIKEEEIEEKIDLEKPYNFNPTYSEYEHPIKVRKARVRKKTVKIKKENPVSLEEEIEDDVIIISSDGE